MKRISLCPRERRMLRISLGMGFLVLHGLVLWPWWQRERVVARELKELRAEIAYRYEILRHAREWKKRLVDLTKRQEMVLPHMESREAWMKHLELLAEKSGVQLLQRRSVRSEEKTLLNQLRVDCSMHGELEAVVKFMNAILQDASRPQIVSCQISSLKFGRNPLKGQLTLAVSLKNSVFQ